MLTDCLVVGDSIALGIAAALAALGPYSCERHARVGAVTHEIAAMVPARRYGLAIISTGSNDDPDQELNVELRRLRSRVRAERVVWIYPRGSRRAWTIYAIARGFGDGAIGLNRLPSRDGVHPHDYRAAARLVAAKTWGSTAGPSSQSADCR